MNYETFPHDADVAVRGTGATASPTRGAVSSSAGGAGDASIGSVGTSGSGSRYGLCRPVCASRLWRGRFVSYQASCWVTSRRQFSRPRCTVRSARPSYPTSVSGPRRQCVSTRSLFGNLLVEATKARFGQGRQSRAD